MQGPVYPPRIGLKFRLGQSGICTRRKYPVDAGPVPLDETGEIKDSRDQRVPWNRPGLCLQCFDGQSLRQTAGVMGPDSIILDFYQDLLVLPEIIPVDKRIHERFAERG